MAGHTMEGNGQRGLNREERSVHEQICDALEADPILEASGIEVLVDGSEVFLSGTVFHAADRARAEQIASTAAGNRTVWNRLGLFTDGPVAPSNLNVDATIDGATRQTEDGGYDELS